MIHKIKLFIQLIIFSPIFLIVLNNKKTIRELTERWYEVFRLKRRKSVIIDFFIIFFRAHAFRTVTYYYCNVETRNILRKLYPGKETLTIPLYQNIGKGLVIQHGECTLVGVEKMGVNCQVWQGCTIGKAYSGNNSPCPSIGNDVKICCNSVVIGNIKIGNGAVIGAGSVCRKSIPPYAITAGNPAKVIGFTMTPQESYEYELLNYPIEERTPIDTLEKNYKKYYLDRIKEINQILKI